MIKIGCVLLFFISMAGCSSIYNYVDADAPKFISNDLYIQFQADEFIVSSYNIKRP